MLDQLKDKVKIGNLIKSNIVDMQARHLMIITDSEDFFIQYIAEICKGNKQEYQIFLGSDF